MIVVLSPPAFATRLEVAKRRTEVGRASWYGTRTGLHGELTASGERFDATSFTAAHRSHPFGTRLRVTNLTNGLSVVVRVNDRGPGMRGRVIDVSRAAAGALGFQRRGLARVRV
ncbi:MAG: septal ring lytic transglycosylase RlpA family protein, partial [Candidatus Binatia bacterium]